MDDIDLYVPHQANIRIIEHAVKGMLPKNRLARTMLTKLKVFAGPEHTHAAQNPVKISI